MGVKFVATEPLFVGRARAHNVGDVVPASNVERNGWQDKVRKVTEASDGGESPPPADTPPADTPPADTPPADTPPAPRPRAPRT